MLDSKSRFVLVRATLLLLGAFASILAAAAEEGDGGRIALKDAVARTLELNPHLVAFGYQLKSLDGRVEQAGLAPNPELTISVEDVIGTGALSGFDGAETTVSLAWLLDRGVRERREDAARAYVSLGSVEREILRVDAAAETARRFLDVLENQAREAMVDEAVGLAERTIAAVQRRLDAGRSPAADLARAQASLATAKLAREDINHELTTGRHRLAAQWGSLQPDFSGVLGDAFTLPDPIPLETLRQRLAGNPEMARYLSQERADEAELRLAQSERKPAWQARLGVRSLDGIDDQALVAGISIPLAIRNNNQGRIAEASALVSKSRADTVAANVRIETTLFVLYEALEHSLHRAHTLRADVIPRIEAALKETDAAYAMGRYGFYEWRAVQAELIESRSTLIDASVDAYRNIIEIERLTGVPLARHEATGGNAP